MAYISDYGTKPKYIVFVLDSPKSEKLKNWRSRKKSLLTFSGISV